MRMITVAWLTTAWLLASVAGVQAQGGATDQEAAKAKPAKAKPAKAKPKPKPKPAPEAAPTPPSDPPPAEDTSLQVLVIPISGTVAPELGDSPQPLTDTLLTLTRSTGSRPVEARVGKSDIIAITGCSAESRECFDAVADTVGVDQLIFGTIEQAPGDPGDPDNAGDAPGTTVVTLTLVEPRKRSYQTRRIVLHATNEAGASKEFEHKARAFLNGEPEPADSAWQPESAPAPMLEDKASSRTFAVANVKGYTWGVTGGGVALVATSIALLAAGQSKQDQADNAPTNTAQDLEDLAALERSGERLTNWGNGLLIAGAVATTVGVVLIVKQGYFDDEQAAVKLGVTPLLDAKTSGFTVTLGGTF